MSEKWELAKVRRVCFGGNGFDIRMYIIVIDGIFAWDPVISWG